MEQLPLKRSFLEGKYQALLQTLRMYENSTSLEKNT